MERVHDELRKARVQTGEHFPVQSLPIASSITASLLQYPASRRSRIWLSVVIMATAREEQHRYACWSVCRQWGVASNEGRIEVFRTRSWRAALQCWLRTFCRTGWGAGGCLGTARRLVESRFSFSVHVMGRLLRIMELFDPRYRLYRRMRGLRT